VERSTLRQIKGLGGALLREKIVAEASQRFVVAPTSLRSWTGLGSRVPLAVEVVRFGHVATMGFSRYHARDSGKVASTVTVAESHPRCKVH
jgi:ribose 5-phosphate isomerase